MAALDCANGPSAPMPCCSAPSTRPLIDWSARASFRGRSRPADPSTPTRWALGRLGQAIAGVASLLAAVVVGGHWAARLSVAWLHAQPEYQLDFRKIVLVPPPPPWIRLGALGLEISITEMDIRIQLPSDAQELQQQALGYGDAITFCLAEPNCAAVVSWGFTDKFSWVPGVFSGFGDALMFDMSYAIKPAYTAMQSVLEAKITGVKVDVDPLR